MRPSRAFTLGHAAAVLGAIVLAGVFLAARGDGRESPAPAARPAIRLLFTASPADARPIDQSVRLLQKRLRAVLPGAHVARTGENVTVTLSHAPFGARTEILALAAPGRLAFYDWEADAIAPNGSTAASQLSAMDPIALEISQGAGAAAPGNPGSGSLSLHHVLTLAGNLGPGGPRRTEYIGRLKLGVPTGYLVVRAAGPRPGETPDRFYLLKDRPALSNAGVVNPEQSADPSTGQPEITFGFTKRGGRAFHALTAAIARRGKLVSSPGQRLNQHFAVVLDNRLITVPFIDYKQYPDGVSPRNGADLSGSFTTQSAKLTALLLRYGPLPVNLTAG